MKTIRFLLSVLAFLMMANDSPGFTPDFRINALGVALAAVLLATSAGARKTIKSLFKNQQP